MRILQRVYEYRNSAVHGGRIKEEKNADMILRQATSLCGSIIRSIVEKQCFPDWEQLILGGGKDWHS